MPAATFVFMQAANFYKGVRVEGLCHLSPRARRVTGSKAFALKPQARDYQQLGWQSRHSFLTSGKCLVRHLGLMEVHPKLAASLGLADLSPQGPG